jgi:hypothetical protein
MSELSSAAGGERALVVLWGELPVVCRETEHAGCVRAEFGAGGERALLDCHTAYPRAIRERLGEEVEHRCNQYLNNQIEQDHRGIKQHYYPMRGFRNYEAAARIEYILAYSVKRQ